MTLPAISAWDAAALTQPGGVTLARQNLNAMLAAQHRALGMVAAPTLQLSAAGVLPAPSAGHLLVATWADSTLQDLNQIALPADVEPRLILLTLANAARDVRVRHDVGGDGKVLLCNARSFTLGDSFSFLFLRRSGSSWLEITRSYGADQVGSNSSGEWCWIGPGRLRQTGTIATSATAAAQVAFPKPFSSASSVRISAQNVQGGEPASEYVERIWDRTSSGFKIKTFNNSGAQVALTVHWAAEGDGE